MRKKLRVKVPSIPGINFGRSSQPEQVRQTIGQAPGTLIYTGKKTEGKVSIEIFSYDANNIEEKSSNNLADCSDIICNNRINWVNIDGLHNVDLINEIGDQFKLHPLLLEDVLNVEQRPKCEEFENYLFFTIKMFHQTQDQGISYEHVSFALGKNTVISFQERPEDLFDLLRDRLRKSFGKIRNKHTDYLFYRFIDTIVDNYYFVLDSFAEKIEQLEDEVMENPSTKTLQKLQGIRKELIYLRRSVYPLRESINSLMKSESPLMRKETEKYFADVYDHTIHVIESLDTYRELLGGIMDLYMNSVSNKMNEIMKVLTIMSTIFIPLTFIAGIYGMNFENIPELGFEWGYPAVWILMLVIAIIMLLLFKKKKWI
jgi:magnesium transporter